MVVTISWTEAAIWCAASWSVLVARLISRRMRVGAWNNLQSEDLLAVVVLILATALMVLCDKIMNIYAIEDATLEWTPERLKRRRVGAKLMLAGEQVGIATIWSNKVAMLLMYHRLTQLTRQRKQVLVTACFTGIVFLTMEILFFAGWCRPFGDYFAFSPADTECLLYKKHYITSLSFNVLTDILILLIPLPLLFGLSGDLEARHTWRIRLIIGIIILLGCYGIGAAIASKVYFLSNLSSERVFDWNIREAYTCTLCANLPRTYPLLEYCGRFVSRTTQSMVSKSTGAVSGMPPTSDAMALNAREMMWREAKSQGILVSTDIEMVNKSVRSVRGRDDLGEGGWERLTDDGDDVGLKDRIG